ncbi:FAD-dependent thymidylate synthase [uncultured Anaerococcus sp.]|uniref:FAD-dependent thymidylate synthase n=1 Tax=uncultured Anaerococcus sp. TaxID=293428 RepID=UPI0028048207|nr:FAD-dependent thymidylate synthase [uncultured Anaerococcus sp.]
MVRILENKVELVKENLSYDEVLYKIEQATRLCYRSKKSKSQEGQEKFLSNLMKIGHESIIEHGSLSFIITTDRACANQIVRHRMASYSQESSRYINLSDLEIVLDQSYTEEEKDSIKWVCEDLARAYEELGGDKKSTRDKARAILPQCTATRLYMTMNFREIRHFLKLRLDKAAHQSIREIAYQILKIVKKEYPVFVFDFDLADYEDVYNPETWEDILTEND